MIVLDTNVVSELMRQRPSPRVADWVRAHVVNDLRTTAVTVAEVAYGMARLPKGRRRTELAGASSAVFASFADQVLSFDAAAAVTYAEIVAARDVLGEPIDGFDAQIAAICRVHGAVLATRNERDFRDIGIAIVDPWEDPAREL